MGVAGHDRATPTSPSSSQLDSLIEIGARHEIAPLRQGELDLMCAVYSVVNAIRLALQDFEPLKLGRARQLFNAGVSLLEQKGSAAEALTSGVGTRRWHSIARRLVREVAKSNLGVELERPDFSKTPAIGEVIGWIEASVAERKPVLVRLAGGIKHFTVIAGVTCNRFELFDSCGHRFIKRASCGLSDSYYRIPPKALLRIAVSRRG